LEETGVIRNEGMQPDKMQRKAQRDKGTKARSMIFLAQ